MFNETNKHNQYMSCKNIKALGNVWEIEQTTNMPIQRENALKKVATIKKIIRQFDICTKERAI